MNEVIIVRHEKCVGCNACVRSCPSPEANVTKVNSDGKCFTTINPDRCIACGECVRTCTHGARDYLDDTEACMSRMTKEKLIILVTPAIKTALPTRWKGILDWFKKKGCLVYDVSLGADICTWAHLRLIENNKVGNIITQPCASIVRYIEVYQPKLLMNLAPVQSPICCLATYVKKVLRRNNPIAVLTPCIANKSEFVETGLVDYNVTFKKLLEYFDRNDIKPAVNKPEDLTYDFEEQQGQLGTLYSMPGGLKENLLAKNPELNIAVSQGVRKVYPELDVYAQMAEYKHPQVFDVLSCEHGCNLGPASGSTASIFDVMMSMREIEKEAVGRQKTSGIRTKEDRLFKKFDDELRIADFMRNYKPMKVSPVPSNKQLEEVFEKMGKNTKQERHYDCQACGYKSCIDMAIAISRGLNVPENCMIYAKSLLKNSPAGSAENADFSGINAKCLEISEKLRKSVASITESMGSISEANQKTGNRATVVNDLLQNVIEFCTENKSMDEESVEQMIEILGMTKKAFTALEENVTVTSSSSSVIADSVTEINRLIEEISTVVSDDSDDDDKE